MSPGFSVGTRISVTWARERSALVAPSKNVAATKPVVRSAAVTVVIFQWTCGTATRKRSLQDDWL